MGIAAAAVALRIAQIEYDASPSVFTGLALALAQAEYEAACAEAHKR